MFGFSGGELLGVLVVAALVMGPKNVAQALYGLRKLLDMVREWSAKLRQETAFDLSSLGIDPADVEKLKNLDLSQYDPRQMVREAVQEEMNAWIAATNGAAAAGKATAAGAAAAMQQTVTPFPVDVVPGQNPLAPNTPAATNGAFPATPQAVAPVSGHGTPVPNYRTYPVSSLNYPVSNPAPQPTNPAPHPFAPASTPVFSSGMPNYLAAPTASSSGQLASSAEQSGAAPGGHRASSDIIKDDDGPLDLHTILNRPDLGGSR